MANKSINEVTPDALMQRFQGSGLKAIIVFTLVVHVVILLGSSIPYLVKTVFNSDTRKMAQEDRITAAVQEATVAIRKIASRYDLNTQDISERFSGGGSRAAAVRADTETEVAAPAEVKAPTEEAERPKSEIEMQLEVREKGPDEPSVDDIF